ncbi:FG-GAP-like repeat-containing protein [Amycolatopsis sp. NPDC098790]|uniref:FG-GAP-like repeat-containing protein n=1 Tax=Amycolatopsis sp. NPDC098790 TaxID=3363939 RepID=UPI0037F96DBD
MATTLIGAAAPAMADVAPTDLQTAPVEDFAYPGAADILANYGVTLISGDGHLIFADCTTAPEGNLGLIRVRTTDDPVTTLNKTICFKALAPTAQLSLKVPAVFEIRGDGQVSGTGHQVTADLTTDTGQHTSVAVKPSGSTPVGVGANPTGQPTTLLQLVVTGVLPDPSQPTDPGSGSPSGTSGFAAKINMDGRACSGALVEPTLVLTAASCFPENPQGGTPAKQTTVTVGRPDLSGTGGHVAKVTSLIVRSDRDVALARLDTTITDVTPLPLPATAGAPGATENLSIVGLGRTQDEWVPNQAHTTQFTAPSTTATTLGLEGVNGADACKGDNGAPVFRQDNAGKQVAVGVVTASWQHNCLAEKETRQGTTGTRVDDLASWIRNQAIVGTAKAVGHGVTLSWTPLAASDDATYSIYANSAGPATNSATQLIGTTKAATFIHSATAHKTWSYLVVASTGGASPLFTATTGARSLTDFTGDGKGDIGTFTRGSTGDVFVASSDGTKFTGTSALWHDRFSVGVEIPLSGDFNGDGKADVATFSRGSTADVYVALSDGTKFDGNGVMWDDYFAANSEVPAVGDFNGDGKDDIATFTLGSTGDVYVALSDGTKFGASALWHGDFGYNAEQPYVGDFNGDGKDDIAVFTRGTTGDVYVALSDGTKFVGSAQKWHDDFAYNTETPAIGDFNGDGKDDIAVFTRGTTADVYVALSDGTKFVGSAQKWQEYFAANDELPGTGDFDGDGKADIITYTRGTAGDVYVALSTGTKFDTSAPWHGNFAFSPEVPVPRAIAIQ